MTDEKIKAMRQRLRDWTSRETSQREPVPYTPPRYDEVFDEGVRWLDEQMTDDENTFDNLLAAAAAHRDEVAPGFAQSNVAFGGERTDEPTTDYGHRCLADDCCTREERIAEREAARRDRPQGPALDRSASARVAESTAAR